MRKRGLCCRPGVRLSDCLVMLVDCIHNVEDIVKLHTRIGSPIILVFLIPRASTQFQGKPFSGERRKIHGGGKILRFSTEIAVYLGNGIRDRPVVSMER